jgi:hypothetical protein
MCWTPYLIPKKVPPSNRAIDLWKPSTDVPAIGPPSPPAPSLLTTQLSLLETVYGEFHERLGFGWVCSVCLVKHDAFAEFFFESLPFFSQEIAEDHFGTFFDETSDYAFADASGTAGNDGNLDWLIHNFL